MRYSKEEKEEIIRLVERSELSVNRTIKELNSVRQLFTTGTTNSLKAVQTPLKIKRPVSPGIRFQMTTGLRSSKWL
jgi:hypothetical protein